MKRKNPNKAQLRRDNARLQRAARREHETADHARDAMFRADRMRDNALQLLGELAPDLLNLLVRPTYLQPDPGGPMVRSLPRSYVRSLLRNLDHPYDRVPVMIEHWITRMRMEIEANPQRFNHCRVLCFQMQRPKGHDSLAWQYAFDDRLIQYSPTGWRHLILSMAERLCDELEQKIGGRRE